MYSATRMFAQRRSRPFLTAAASHIARSLCPFDHPAMSARQRARGTKPATSQEHHRNCELWAEVRREEHPRSVWPEPLVHFGRNPKPASIRGSAAPRELKVDSSPLRPCVGFCLPSSPFRPESRGELVPTCRLHSEVCSLIGWPENSPCRKRIFFARCKLASLRAPAEFFIFDPLPKNPPANNFNSSAQNHFRRRAHPFFARNV
jgi:hypothetical protein